MVTEWELAIDFGTSTTAASVAAPGGVEIFSLGEGPRIPSTVCWKQAPGGLPGDWLVGEVAEMEGWLEPRSVERCLKRKPGQEFLWLGGDRVPVTDAVAALFRYVLAESAERFGCGPRELRLTHPIGWGETRMRRLCEAASVVGFEEPLLIPDLAAVAIFRRRDVEIGDSVAVYDLGAGSFDTAVLRRTADRFDVIGAPGGLDELGGHHFDERLYRFLALQLDEEQRCLLSSAESESEWRRANENFRRDIHRAKERLARSPDATVRNPVPGQPDMELSLSEFEALIVDDVERTVDELERTIAGAGRSPDDLSKIYLAGGSSRIPLVSRLIERRLGKPPHSTGDPKGVVALGAAAAPHRAMRRWVPEATRGGAPVPRRSVQRQQALPRRDDLPPGNRARPRATAATLHPVGDHNPDYELLDSLTVPHPDGDRRIELCAGDLTALPTEEACDVLVVSVLPNDYSPTARSLVGALARKGVSLSRLARRMAVDLRETCSCWLSEDLSGVDRAIQYKRILCFEPARTDRASAVVGDIFRALLPFLGDTGFKRVAMPIVSAGDAGVAVQKMLPALVEAAMNWMSLGISLTCLKIFVPRIRTQRDAAIALFADLRRNLAPAQADQDERCEYDLFLSYAHEDSAYAEFITEKLSQTDPVIRLFLDRQSLEPGSAWQHELFDAIDSSRRVVALYSPAYVRSKVCKEEFNIAWARSRDSASPILFPLYLFSAPLPTYMQLVQYVDCREGAFDRLSSACTHIAGVDADPRDN